jgi:uncharacterized protein
MVRQLGPAEIESVLRSELVGRLGCHVNGRTYVVPITYAYADGAIYARSTLGLKLRMMRDNPNVCFQVDHIDDLTNWKSVIAWGRYEELEGGEASHAAAALFGKMLPRTLTTQASQTPKTLACQYRARTEDVPAVIFRIRIVEKTGRSESSENRVEDGTCG